jgi:hypothetical protein
MCGRIPVRSVILIENLEDSLAQEEEQLGMEWFR